MITIRSAGTNGVYTGEIRDAIDDLLFALDIDGTSPEMISEVEEIRDLLLSGNANSPRAKQIASRLGITFE